MTQQFGNAVEVDTLSWYVSAAGWAGGNMSLRLFKNDVEAAKTPAQLKAITNADMVEATFPGYAALTLVAATWVVTGGLPSAAVYPLQTFERSSTGAGELIYGYWIRRVSDSRILTYEPFPGPVTVANLGQRIKFAPTIPARDRNDP